MDTHFLRVQRCPNEKFEMFDILKAEIWNLLQKADKLTETDMTWQNKMQKQLSVNSEKVQECKCHSIKEPNVPGMSISIETVHLASLNDDYACDLSKSIYAI